MSASILTPSAANTSAEPECDEKARLPCLATGTPTLATTRPVAVEMLKVPEASPPVPTVSIVPGGASIVTALARMMRAAPVISSTVSPRTRSAINNAPICDGRGVAAHDDVERRLGLAFGQARARPRPGRGGV